MNPRHPIYIVSKGRWKTRLTAKHLEFMKVPYRIVVEESEYADYCSVIDPAKVLILPQRYLDEYDTCDSLGTTKSKGPGAARNFAWEHAISQGATWHWVMDDNIDGFLRLNRNLKLRARSGTIFKAAEDFVERYENIAVSGLNYAAFCKAVDKMGPYILNTRIYSCLLIRNDIPYRWRGRYNEDTDLSLRVLKDGWCTLQFNAFLADKYTTQRIPGGNTKDFYNVEGTKNKSQMLVDLHPDVSKMVWKFNRWHHHVDYSSFKSIKLVRKPSLNLSEGNNEYGMVVRELTKEKPRPSD
jgi:hypothetical protein